MSNLFRSSPMFDSIEIVRAQPKAVPEVLGCCDDCGVEIPLDGHLYRQPDGSYACPSCDAVARWRESIKRPLCEPIAICKECSGEIIDDSMMAVTSKGPMHEDCAEDALMRGVFGREL
jgi:hypothetical protein